MLEGGSGLLSWDGCCLFNGLGAVAPPLYVLFSPARSLFQDARFTMAQTSTTKMLAALLLLVWPLTVLSHHEHNARYLHKHRLHRHIHQAKAPIETEWGTGTGSTQGAAGPNVIEDVVADINVKTGKQQRKRHRHQDSHAVHARQARPLRNTPVPSSTTTVKVITSAVATGTVQILPSPTGAKPDTTGSVHTSLATSGRPSTQPILTSSISKPTTTLTPTTSMFKALFTSAPPVAPSVDIFATPIGTSAPPSQIKSRNDHPVPRLGITQNAPINTNKFYANFFLGGQTSPTFLQPYSVAWAKGSGASGSWGISISHIEARQRVYGPTGSNGAAAYYLNPIGIQSMVISAKELGSDTVLTTDQLTAYSARVSLRANAAAAPAVQFPFVQGNAFITAQFNGATPLIQTGVFYRTVTRATKEAKAGITKYKFTLEDGTIWLLYAYHTSGSALDLQVVNNGLAQAKGPFYGIIQIAKDPGSGETFYDQACGAYPSGVQLSGNVAGAKGTYTFTYIKAGMSNTKLAMMALPHHIQSFDDATRAGVNSSITLQTTTKGLAAAVSADSWTMVESKLPVNMAFAPWSINRGSMAPVSASIKATILKTAKQEISQNIMAQTNQNSMYFGGKALAKFAAIIYTINDLLGEKALAATALGQLKEAFAQFASNQQQYPLLYESAWGGVVSSASYVTGNSGADFGNSYYNDHHFHYGYFIYTAAIIGYLDPTWVKANKDYVNMLVRDISNPSDKDPYFPVHRAFDWYNGHSWAHGLFESLDGKDQESSSEDVMHAYAIKMWGQTVGDSNMVAR